MANDEFDALDALEREAKEYDKVSSEDRLVQCTQMLMPESRMLRLIESSKLSN